MLRLRGMEAPAEVRAMYSGYDGADDDSDEESEDNFGAAFDGPSDFRESKRPPRDKESLVVAPSSTTGTSTATRDLVPGDGYYNLYRPYGRRNSATPSELADQAARRRFRPGVDYRDGKVFWTRPKDLFTVPAETMNGSGKSSYIPTFLQAGLASPTCEMTILTHLRFAQRVFSFGSEPPSCARP